MGGLAAHRPATASAARTGRAVKLAVGVGPVFVLAPLYDQVVAPVAIPLLASYAVLTVAVAWRTNDHRGLSNTLAHLDLRISDESEQALEER